jgi:UDPglucose--hexose-1-phosphate uridylyltransferase
LSAEPEVRIDQLTGLRTILAASRAGRPFDFPQPGAGAGGSGSEQKAGEPRPDCPFCEGNEDQTPAELWADRPGDTEPDAPGWSVRVVPNLYPALSGDSDPTAPASSSRSAGGSIGSVDPLRASARGGEPDLFASVPASGEHEVIIHTPRHRLSLAELDSTELEAAVGAWRERIAAHLEAAYVQLIVNEGRDAGASLEHTHAQLYALSFVPTVVARERERVVAYGERTMGGDLLADIGSEEVRRGERLVAIDDEMLLICPWASRSPFELRLMPRRAAPRFEEGAGVEPLLGTALAALRARLGTVTGLNLWLHTAPRGVEKFHWHIDIAPRLAAKAGFELSTGVDINVYAPERAASELRDCLPR